MNLLIATVCLHVIGRISPFVISPTPKLPQTPCDSSTCYFGTCHRNITGGSECQCKRTFMGEECQQVIIPIAPSTWCIKQRCYHGNCVYDYSIYEYRCICYEGVTGKTCNTQNGSTASLRISTLAHSSAVAMIQTTTTATTQSKNTSFERTKTTQNNTKRCAELQTHSDLGPSVISSSPYNGKCPSGSYVTPEAFVFAHCSLNSPNEWIPGTNVMKQCSSLPLNIPIATFTNNNYTQGTDTIGLFLGCTSGGFKIGIQRCDSKPAVEYIDIGVVSTETPYDFYTIQ